MERPNFSYIDDLSGGDEAFRAKLLAVIKQELPLEIAEYKKDMLLNDFSKSAGHVHKLKHKISVMGMEKSYYLAAQFEEELKNHNTATAEEFARILAVMQDFAAAL